MSLWSSTTKRHSSRLGSSSNSNSSLSESLCTSICGIRLFGLCLFVGSIVWVSASFVEPNNNLRHRMGVSPSSTKEKTSSTMAVASSFRAGASSVTSSSGARSISTSIPKLLYGTAWKKERTADLVFQAVKAGFRGVDTACQPKHYFEPGVGAALERLYADGVVKREDLFLQTKFTPLNGQDPNNIPYDKNAPLEEQVEQSFQRSLVNLRTSYLDSLILHSPLASFDDTMRVWRSFEKIHATGGTLNLGISNCYDLKLFRSLYDASSVKPSFLQNRFYRDSGYDRGLRAYCLEKGVQYQSFWTLTANPHVVNGPVVSSIAKKYDKTNAQVFFRFMQSQGVVVLTGTKDVAHMMQDLAAQTISLTAEEIEQINQQLN